MTGFGALTVSLALLAGVLTVAIHGTSKTLEGPLAALAALLLIVLGIVPAEVAGHTVGKLAGTVAFLAAILVLGHLLAEEGVFGYLGSVAAARSAG